MLFKRVLFIFMVVLTALGVFLTTFELLLYNFQSTFNDKIKDVATFNLTWLYLLQQEYITFISTEVYTLHEKRHLLDVKRVLAQTYNIWLVFLSISALGLVVFRKVYKKLLYYVSVLGIFLIFILILASIDFVYCFDLFHSFLFKSQTWIFQKESILIMLFPLNYFQQFFFLFLIINSIIMSSLFFLFKPKNITIFRVQDRKL